MKTVLVTGCSSGFGALTARAFAAAGYRVVATMRDPARADPGIFDGAGAIEVRALDVTDGDDVAACVAAVLADHGRIDVLVNNAGVHLLGAVEDMAEADLDRVMRTNFFGVLAMSRAVLPAMRRAGGGHILTVSSVGSRVGRVMDGIYCASKAAVESALEAMRYEVARFGVQVAVVCPGAFRTGIDRNFTLSDAQARSPYAALHRYRMERVREACRDGGDPAEVAAALLRIAGDPAPAFRHLVGDKAIALDAALSAADAEARAELLTRFSGIGWWIAGAAGPEAER